MQKKSISTNTNLLNEIIYNVYADVYLSAYYQSVQLKKQTKNQKTAV